MADPVVYALRLYWSPPATGDRGLGSFHLRAGEGRGRTVQLTDVAALVARYRDVGETSEADRLAAQVDSLSAVAAEHFRHGKAQR